MSNTRKVILRLWNTIRMNVRIVSIRDQVLRQHRYRKHGKRRYQCEECSFMSTTITEIRKHKIKAAHFGIGLPLPR